MLLELEQLKKHLNIDEEFTEDDDYILYLQEVAENLIQKHIDKTFEDIVTDDGEIPQGIIHAVILLVANLYANRESIAFSPVYSLPHSLDYILSMYRDYTDANI